MCSAIESASFALLEGFRCSETSFAIDTGIQMECLQHPPSSAAYEPAKYLADFYQMRLSMPQFWLHIEPSSGLKPSEATNLTLHALLVVRRSQTCVPIRLDPQGPAIILGRFQRVGSSPEDSFNRQDLEKTSYYVCALRKAYARKSRLRSAIALSFQGCASHRWHSAYLCFAAALETLLTYSEDWGLTRRLAKSFACLLSTGKDERDAHYRDFMRLYGIRSDIVHGRAYVHDEAPQNLTNLAIFSDQLRSVWARVLGDAGTQEILEQEDAIR